MYSPRTSSSTAESILADRATPEKSFVARTPPSSERRRVGPRISTDGMLAAKWSMLISMGAPRPIALESATSTFSRIRSKSRLRHFGTYVTSMHGRSSPPHPSLTRPRLQARFRFPLSSAWSSKERFQTRTQVSSGSSREMRFQPGKTSSSNTDTRQSATRRRRLRRASNRRDSATSGQPR